jgi:hypothetical protein
MTAELALLRRHLPVRGAGADVPAMLGAAYKASEYPGRRAAGRPGLRCVCGRRRAGC